MLLRLLGAYLRKRFRRCARNRGSFMRQHWVFARVLPRWLCSGASSILLHGRFPQRRGGLLCSPLLPTASHCYSDNQRGSATESNRGPFFRQLSTVFSLQTPV